MIKLNTNQNAQPASSGTTKRMTIPNEVATGSKPMHQPAKSRANTGTFFTRHQTMINFWLDSALLLNFMALIWVSVIVRFIFPPAENAAGFVLWGLSLSQLMDVQFGVLAVFCLGIVVHLMLHWTWVCGVIGSKLLRSRDGTKRTMDDGQRTIFGVGLMIVLLNVMGVGIAIAALAIRSPM
jgi:hypothetical protein